MLRCFSIFPHPLNADIKWDKGGHPFQMVTMETEHFEPSLQTATPEILPLTNQGQLAHLDAGFLQTGSQGQWKKKMQLRIFYHAKRKYAEDRSKARLSAIRVTHSLWPPAGLW